MPAKTICPKCSGTGVAGYETTWPCPWCGGAGTVEPAAPTLPEPRPDDEGRETIERAYITGYLDGYDAVDERSLEKRRAIAESSATAYADQRRALTPHPAPLGATPITDDDVRRAVCDYNDWKYAEMMPHVSLRDTNSRALRVVLENFASRAAPLGATRSMTPEEVESQKQFRRSISRPLGATDEGKDWRPEDADNLRQLRIMCFDLKAQLVPFGASADGWESAIGTLARAIRRAALQAEAR